MLCLDCVVAVAGLSPGAGNAQGKKGQNAGSSAQRIGPRQIAHCVASSGLCASVSISAEVGGGKQLRCGRSEKRDSKKDI